ncbi:MAG: hypothetical protein COZ12_00505, partial [Deltaproteobacteria bacterium CG_4_10_14_3_um_filter_60_8]
MDEIKVFVNTANNAVIVCPRCGLRKSSQVEQFKGVRHTIKVRCTCSHQFTVHLDFRKNYRKTTDLGATYLKKDVELVGYYVNLSRGDGWDETRAVKQAVNCKIKNISMGGIGLQPLGLHMIKEEDELRVFFHLDDAKRSVIDRNVVVVSVSKILVGCRFTEAMERDQALGFYLL